MRSILWNLTRKEFFAVAMCPEKIPVLCNLCNTSFIFMKTHSDSQGENEEDGEKKESQKMRNYLVKNLLDSEMSYFECIDMIRKVRFCSYHKF